MQSDLETNYEVARQQTHRNKYYSLFARTLHKLNWHYFPLFPGAWALDSPALNPTRPPHHLRVVLCLADLYPRTISHGVHLNPTNLYLTILCVWMCSQSKCTKAFSEMGTDQEEEAGISRLREAERLDRLQAELEGVVAKDSKYWLQNDAKFRAVAQVSVSFFPPTCNYCSSFPY